MLPLAIHISQYLAPLPAPVSNTDFNLSVWTVYCAPLRTGNRFGGPSSVLFVHSASFQWHLTVRRAGGSFIAECSRREYF